MALLARKKQVDSVRAPGITHRIPVPYGQWAELLADPLGFQSRAQERFGDIFRFTIGPVVVHFLYHPDHVRRVLYDHQKNYLRGWHFALLRRVFGKNLTVSEGAFWLRQRRLAQPAFNRQRLAEYSKVMVDAASDLVSRWHSLPPDQPIEARRELSRLTLAITSRTLFDRDASGEANEVGQAFGVLGEYFEYRLDHPISAAPSWVPTATNRRFKNAVSTLNEVVRQIIRERFRDETDHGDLLSMLIAASDEDTGERMTEDQLRAEVINFLLAGYETTATALTWTFYLLASHTAVCQRVRDEIKKVIGDRLPVASDAAQLPYLRSVIYESLRLYPPVWIVPRQVVKKDEIDGFRIPRRSTVFLCPYITHRHPDFWEEPEVFNPDRFTADRVTQLPKGAYFPFLGGAHQCIGNEFAMLEMQLAIARVLQEFEISVMPDQVIRPKASLGLWPSGPVWLAVSRL